MAARSLAGVWAMLSMRARLCSCVVSGLISNSPTGYRRLFIIDAIVTLRRYMLQIDCLHRFDELSSCTVNLDIRHLKLIVAVTEEKSVTRAGEVLHLTQSALSHQLREIEEKLGIPLFLRMNKKMILTPA